MDWTLEEALEYYRRMGAPGDQTALTNLLREIQKNNGGGIPKGLLPTVAEHYSIKESLLLALIRRIPSLRLADVHCLELCSGPNCPKKRDLAGFVEKTWGAKPKGFTVRYVPCMRMCGKGPNIRWDGKLYNQADEELLKKLIHG